MKDKTKCQNAPFICSARSLNDYYYCFCAVSFVFCVQTLLFARSTSMYICTLYAMHSELFTICWCFTIQNGAQLLRYVNNCAFTFDFQFSHIIHVLNVFASNNLHLIDSGENSIYIMVFECNHFRQNRFWNRIQYECDAWATNSESKFRFSTSYTQNR